LYGGWEQLLQTKSGSSTQCRSLESLSKITAIGETGRASTNSSGGRSAKKANPGRAKASSGSCGDGGICQSSKQAICRGLLKLTAKFLCGLLSGRSEPGRQICASRSLNDALHRPIA
jgi:hypothetical protein